MELAQINKIPFFQNFSNEQIAKILPIMQVRELKKDEALIEQGSLNLNLFFLLDGKVKILVDGESIVDITRYGEVFGEISIVSHQLSTADVIAAKNSIFAEMDLNAVGEMKDASIQAMIYRSCAEILAIKLVKTNEIAKTYKNFIDEYEL